MNKYNEVMDKVKVTDEMRNRILQNIENTDIESVSQIHEAVPVKENKIVPFIRRYGAMAAMFAVILVGAYAVFVALPGSDKGASTSAPSAGYEMAESATESAMESAEEYAATETAEETDSFMAQDSISNAKPVMEGTPLPSHASKADETAGSFEIESPVGTLEFASAEELSHEAGNVIADIESFADKSTESHYLLYENGMMEIDYFVDGSNIYFRKASEEAAEEYANNDITGEYIDYSVVLTKSVEGTEVTLRGTDEAFNVASWTLGGYEYSLIHEKGLDETAMTEVIAGVLGQ